MPTRLRAPARRLFFDVALFAAAAAATAWNELAPGPAAVAWKLAPMGLLMAALIALSRWVVTIPHPRVAILATYYVAQRLLLGGVEPPGDAESAARAE